MYVYIASSHMQTLYIGVTNDIRRRMWEHKNKLIPGLTAQYNIASLVYFEETDSPLTAIEREKTLKGWKRDKKLALIETRNPHWNDLAADWYE